MAGYLAAKARIFENQKESDYLVLNYDDEEVRALSDNVKSKKIFFSRKEHLDCGVYLDDDKNIIINIDLRRKDYGIKRYYNGKNGYWS